MSRAFPARFKEVKEEREERETGTFPEKALFANFNVIKGKALKLGSSPERELLLKSSVVSSGGNEEDSVPVRAFFEMFRVLSMVRPERPLGIVPERPALAREREVNWES